MAALLPGRGSVRDAARWHATSIYSAGENSTGLMGLQTRLLRRRSGTHT
jgi:hypothetical protein